jgi:hypothetical protein
MTSVEDHLQALVDATNKREAILTELAKVQVGMMAIDRRRGQREDFTRGWTAVDRSYETWGELERRRDQLIAELIVADAAYWSEENR